MKKKNVPSSPIEKLAVMHVNLLAVVQGTTIDASIPVDDKGVSFDGHINVYKDSSLKKTSYLGMVPVQVKGKTVQNISPLQAKFSANMDDLKNYYRGGGVLYFVCEIKNLEVVVFAKILLPLDLKALINAYGDQKTATIYLHPIRSNKALALICNHFLREKNRQPVAYIGKHSFVSHEFERLKVSRISFEPSKEQSNFINQEMYLYGVAGEIEYPISIVKFEKLSHKGETHIEINGISIPYHYELTELSENNQIILEHSFLINYSRKTKSVKFKILRFHSLESYRKTLWLLEKIESEKSISLFEGAIQFSDLTWNNGEFAEIEKELAFIESVTKVYDKVGVPHDYVSKGSKENLIDFTPILNEVFIEGNYDSIKADPKKSGILSILLGDDYILTFYSPDEVEKIQSVAGESFKNKEVSFVIEKTSESFIVSPFLLIEPKELLSAANVSLELVKNSFHPGSHDYNDYTFLSTNNFCLQSLNTYDKNGIMDYLYIVEYICSNMIESEISEKNQQIAIINYFQTLFRINGKLSEKHLQQLIDIKESPGNTNDFLLRTCCNVLLNNAFESKHNFNKLDKQVEEDFYTFPIYTLYKQLVETK